MHPVFVLGGVRAITIYAGALIFAINSLRHAREHRCRPLFRGVARGVARPVARGVARGVTVSISKTFREKWVV